MWGSGLLPIYSQGSTTSSPRDYPKTIPFACQCQGIPQTLRSIGILFTGLSFAKVTTRSRLKSISGGSKFGEVLRPTSGYVEIAVGENTP